MTLTKRLQLGVSALVCSAAIASTSGAATPQALSPTDAQRYAAAFEATDRGDFIEAQMQTIEVQDKSLLGYLSFRALMHPTAHKAAFDELAAATSFLQAAARAPETFYGMIAQRQLGRAGAQVRVSERGGAWLIKAAFTQPSTQPSTDFVLFVAMDPRAHRAAALAQLGRV